MICDLIDIPLLDVLNPAFIPFSVLAPQGKGSNTNHQTANTSFVRRSDVRHVYFRAPLTSPLYTTAVACKPPARQSHLQVENSEVYSVMRCRAEIDLCTGLSPVCGCGLTLQCHLAALGPMACSKEGLYKACFKMHLVHDYQFALAMG